MRKRERENPCGICGHYHKCEEGERCGICGHRPVATEGEPPARLDYAFPTEVLKDFLFLGSYDNASRSEVLKTLNVTHILNDNRNLDFDGAIQFLEQCEREKSRVLIHCMSGKNRSAAIVIAFLMKSKGWGLAQCFQLVKDRRPQVQLTDASQRQLVEYEQKLFGPSAGTLAQSVVPAESFPSIIGFGFPKPAGDTQVPTFNQMPASSIFEPVSPNNVPSNFTFGAQRTMEVNPPGNNNGVVPPISSDNQMDSS